MKKSNRNETEIERHPKRKTEGNIKSVKINVFAVSTQ